MGGPYQTPPGRIVQGDVFTASPRRDQNGNPRKNADGSVDSQYFLAIAIPKTDPNVNALLVALNMEDRAAWPNLFDAQGRCLRPDFASKIIDGDSAVPDRRGVAPNTREGWAGCWVLKMASKFAPKAYFLNNGYQDALPGSIKCGDWVEASFSTQSNESNQTPGMYRNLEAVLFHHVDSAIAFGPSAEQRFGARTGSNVPPATSPGYPAPTAVPPGQPGGGPAAGTPYPTPAAPPAAPAASPPAPASIPSPPAAAPPSSAPPPFPDYMVPPAPSARQMTPKAAGAPYESFIQQGWTDDALIAHGYMIT